MIWDERCVGGNSMPWLRWSWVPVHVTRICWSHRGSRWQQVVHRSYPVCDVNVWVKIQQVTLTLTLDNPLVQVDIWANRQTSARPESGSARRFPPCERQHQQTSVGLKEPSVIISPLVSLKAATEVRTRRFSPISAEAIKKELSWLSGSIIFWSLWSSTIHAGVT